jgi:hypothetical protein
LDRQQCWTIADATLELFGHWSTHTVESSIE